MDIRLLLMPQCSGKPTVRTGSGVTALMVSIMNVPSWPSASPESALCAALDRLFRT
jgi:hypothetical protein